MRDRKHESCELLARHHTKTLEFLHKKTVVNSISFILHPSRCVLASTPTAPRFDGTWPRPWGQPVGPMAPTGTDGVLDAGGSAGAPRVVAFPSEDESTGVVSLGWRGPRYDEQEVWTQLRLLWTYLSEGAVAPLTKALVEVEKPLCSRVGPADEIFAEGCNHPRRM